MKQLTDGSMLRHCQNAQRYAELTGRYDPAWVRDVGAHSQCPYTEAACELPFGDEFAGMDGRGRLYCLDRDYVAAVLADDVLRGAEVLSLIEAYLVEWRYRPNEAR